ncbi:MAG: hypothetical protein FD155_3212 [Bacteroidetes bacterium]|nr:MAG: hypothetical protein FD155_3212 [Bacteroidota bacterium]
MVMKIYNCPVCRQAGLPDYRNHHTVCPQCDSDLKPYLLLTSLEKSKTGSILRNWLVTSLILIVLIVSSLFLKNKLEHKGEIIDYNRRQLVLSDSIEQLQEKINYFVKEAESKEKKLTILMKYKVRKGDNAWKIAKMFYGTGSKYNLVEDQNNLKQPYQLNVDQVLIIKLDE